MASERELEQRIRRVEDILEIQQLMSRYACMANQGWNGEVINPDQMPNIFAVDVEWQAKEMNLHLAGIQQVTETFVRTTKDIQFAMHALLNPNIEVSGDRATGKFLMWVAARTQEEPRHAYMSLDLAFTRTPNGWRIQKYDMAIGMVLKAQLAQPHH
jgi:hypothetical protein